MPSRLAGTVLCAALLRAGSSRAQSALRCRVWSVAAAPRSRWVCTPSDASSSPRPDASDLYGAARDTHTEAFNPLPSEIKMSRLALSSWFCIPEEGMKDFELLSRGSAFVVPAFHTALKDHVHVLAAAHVTHPFRFPDMYPNVYDMWLKYVTPEDTNYKLEIWKDESGQPSRPLPPTTKPHLHKNKDLVSFLVERSALGSDLLSELQETRLDTEETRSSGRDVVFLGSIRVDDTRFIPSPIDGVFLGDALERETEFAYAVAHSPLFEGMCGCAVLLRPRDRDMEPESVNMCLGMLFAILKKSTEVALIIKATDIELHLRAAEEELLRARAPQELSPGEPACLPAPASAQVEGSQVEGSKDEGLPAVEGSQVESLASHSPPASSPQKKRKNTSKKSKSKRAAPAQVQGSPAPAPAQVEGSPAPAPAQADGLPHTHAGDGLILKKEE